MELPEARRWLEEAAASGDLFAAKDAASSPMPRPRDPGTAMTLLDKAARKGPLGAMLALKSLTRNPEDS